MTKQVHHQMMVAVAQADEAMDLTLVKHTSDFMEKTLERGRDNGRTQWWNPALCPVTRLEEMLGECVQKGDVESIMVLASMIHYRKNVVTR